MLFSSITFLYAFLPVLLILYFVVPPRGQNGVLLAASLLFYAWGEPVYLFLMLGSILAGYGFGLLIDRFRHKPQAANLLTAASVCVSLSSLVLFKYSDFFLSTVNALTGSQLCPARPCAASRHQLLYFPDSLLYHRRPPR